MKLYPRRRLAQNFPTAASVVGRAHCLALTDNRSLTTGNWEWPRDLACFGEDKDNLHGVILSEDVPSSTCPSRRNLS